MTVAASQIKLTGTNRSIYLLHWGEYADKATSGPFIGATGLDFSVLAVKYRHDRYAAAEAACKDSCYVDEGDFISWLLSNGTLVSIETTDVYIDIRASLEDPFVPKHWPECPECANGRGEPEYGAVRKSLNRITEFKRCTECGHEWGHTEVANDSTKPMLDDDGRDVQGGCVPFSISKACGVEFSTVLHVCQRHGWSHGGMAQSKAINAARELGFELELRSLKGIGSGKAPTLKRLISELPTDRTYIVGVNGHWLALVRGEIMDNDANTGYGRKVVELYEVKIAKAVAA
ncbi:hypothetical protein BVER_01744 [Candidatus Burkholderia verschuerenii]|uniref:Uncharacterized protein n=1 Tax=Candidatus Burkholderia verschuerenii TaxID=242163 RepID=A0A0L0MIZ6_9BURK|nr:hypothetical protein [Candidatus Burkholderia verschuerenii]KND62290.1 hypothetical protein BVER_01744 [Candidatus Burkholderia verschuerenii]